jgi:translocator protein
MRKSNSWFALLGFGAAVAGVAWYGARHSPRDVRTKLWYDRLKKPDFHPPDAVFPVVWTTLYALIAISGWRVWREEDSPERSLALRLWATQLATNARWTKLFFGEHLPKWALADVLSLESIILSYIQTARKVDRTAAACFVPYAAWVAFAALLNEEIVRRNPDAETMLPRAANS